jgi:hypothetical protein
MQTEQINNKAYVQACKWIEEGFVYEDIMILCPSIKARSYASVLQQLLGRNIHGYQKVIRAATRY